MLLPQKAFLLGIGIIAVSYLGCIRANYLALGCVIMIVGTYLFHVKRKE